MKRKVHFFLPAFNVENSIQHLVGEFAEVVAVLKGRGIELSVLIINDASTDNTSEFADFQAEQHDWLSVKHNVQNLGNSANILAGYRWGVESGADIIGCMDADGEHSPYGLLRHINWLTEDGYDGVAGSIIFPDHDQDYTDRHMMRHHGSLQAKMAGVDGMFYIQSPGYNLHCRGAVEAMLELYDEYEQFFNSNSERAMPRWGMHGVVVCLLGQMGVGARIKAAYLECFGQSPNRSWEKLLLQSDAAATHAAMLMKFFKTREQKAA